MLKTPELAMPRTRKVTTVCNGRREVWADYEEAKAYFLELMMTTEGEKRDRAECVYIQLIHGLDECDYSAAWNAPIRNKENGNPNQGTHQSETRNASIRTRNALAVEIISCP